MTTLLFNVAPERSTDAVGRRGPARGNRRARVMDTRIEGEPGGSGERACGPIDARQLTGGTRSSGGTKFERKSRSCGVRLPSPFALILSRMRLTSSRFTS